MPLVLNGNIYIYLPYDPVLHLCKKLGKATIAAKESRVDFDNINDSADPVMVQKWAEEEAKAFRNRDTDEEAMDIFDIKVCKGEFSVTCCLIWLVFMHELASTKAEYHLNLLKEESEASGRRGSSTLLAQGLKIEELQ